MATLHYTQSGQGEPLILLHSGGMSGAEWTPQIPLLARHFRVVVPDHLGHGRSPDDRREADRRGHGPGGAGIAG